MNVTADAATPHVVHEFAKNGREVVRAALDVYQGRPVIDLRVFVPSAGGSFVPTRKGLTLSRESLPQLEAAVRALRDAESRTGVSPEL